MSKATWLFLAVAFSLCAQPTIRLQPSKSPASPTWPVGPPGSHVRFEGILARSDGETLSIELPDQRSIRFRLDERTRYQPEEPPDSLSGFHVADIVSVESQVDSRGYLLAQSVHFMRKASPEEQAEIFQSPEVMHRWSQNLLASSNTDLASDDRRLSLAAKPRPIAEPAPDAGLRARPVRDGGAPAVQAGEDSLIALVRRRVNDAFQRLPNFRAKLVTSLFHSASKPIKWVPESVVAAEIAFEDDHESYNDLQVDGKRPPTAAANADYPVSLDKAWSTGDFETISHCVFSELADSDFHRLRTERAPEGELVVYEFSGGRSSACIGVKYRSQISYPSYQGVLKVKADSGDVRHVEFAATEIPRAFPLDRAERSVDFEMVRIGAEQYLLPATAYWFGCFRNTYSCFLNRIDFRDYRRFGADSTVRFGN